MNFGEVLKCLGLIIYLLQANTLFCISYLHSYSDFDLTQRSHTITETLAY